MHHRAWQILQGLLEVRGKSWGNLGISYATHRSLGIHEKDFFIRCREVLEAALERKLTDSDLHAALDKEIEAERAKSFFFSAVSHDIRTPLNAIIGYSELLICGILDEQERSKALSAISTSGQTLLQLINDVLDLSKLESDRMVITGNPVRRSILEGDRARGRRSLGIPDDALMLLVMGGSLGAKHLNEALIAMRDELMAIDDLYVVHSSGPRNHGEVVTALGTGYGDRWQVFPYIENMGDCLKASDCIVSRSGASSLAEITALGIASLLVPYPHATDDHQTKNARALVKAGACVLIPDDQLEDHLSHDLLHLLRDAELRVQMASSARELGRPNAVSLLADTVLEVAGGGQ